LFIGCQKEPDGGQVTPPPATTCKLEKTYAYDDTGAVIDSALYVYAGDQVSRINYLDYYVTYEYQGSKVSKRNYIETGGTSSFGYDKFTYNSDGTLNKIEFFVLSPLPIVIYSYELTWVGGKLSKIVSKEDLAGSGTLNPEYEYTYTYTGNNITQCLVKDLTTGDTYTLGYQFDTNANYYSKTPDALFTDYLFSEFSPEILAFVLSANSVVVYMEDGASYTVGYTLDDKKNLKELALDGQVLVKYFYKCQ